MRAPVPTVARKSTPRKRPRQRPIAAPGAGRRIPGISRAPVRANQPTATQGLRAVAGGFARTPRLGTNRRRLPIALAGRAGRFGVLPRSQGEPGRHGCRRARAVRRGPEQPSAQTDDSEAASGSRTGQQPLEPATAAPRRPSRTTEPARGDSDRAAKPRHPGARSRSPEPKTLEAAPVTDSESRSWGSPPPRRRAKPTTPDTPTPEWEYPREYPRHHSTTLNP